MTVALFFTCLDRSPGVLPTFRWFPTNRTVPEGGQTAKTLAETDGRWTIRSVRPTKILATVGPASWDGSMIRQLAEAGVDAFRINCSHVTTEQIAPLIATIRENAPHCAVLVDIQGPKLRLGPEPLHLVTGTEQRVGLDAFAFDLHASGVDVNHRILLQDGMIRLVVTSLTDDMVTVLVEAGGDVKARAGVNLPDGDSTRLELLGEKDLADISAARDAGVDWIALSYVSSSEDVLAAREHTGDVPLMAKIERRQALENIESICQVADGVMAARGDLGVETPYEEVPSAQRTIAKAALAAGIVSVCATEMLESMRTSVRPTRAEVADVAAASIQGFDTVMLSAETSVGVDPVNCVRVMASICEANQRHDGNKTFADGHGESAAISAAAAALALRTDAKAILALTTTGLSARILSSCRPPCPILAVSEHADVLRRLRLHRNVQPVHAMRHPLLDESVATAVGSAKLVGLLEEGDLVVVSASRGQPSRPADTIWTLDVD